MDNTSVGTPLVFQGVPPPTTTAADSPEGNPATASNLKRVRPKLQVNTCIEPVWGSASTVREVQQQTMRSSDVVQKVIEEKSSSKSNIGRPHISTFPRSGALVNRQVLTESNEITGGQVTVGASTKAGVGAGVEIRVLQPPCLSPARHMDVSRPPSAAISTAVIGTETDLAQAACATGGRNTLKVPPILVAQSKASMSAPPLQPAVFSYSATAAPRTTWAAAHQALNRAIAASASPETGVEFEGNIPCKTEAETYTKNTGIMSSERILDLSGDDTKPEIARASRHHGQMFVKTEPYILEGNARLAFTDQVVDQAKDNSDWDPAMDTKQNGNIANTHLNARNKDVNSHPMITHSNIPAVQQMTMENVGGISTSSMVKQQEFTQMHEPRRTQEFEANVRHWYTPIPTALMARSSSSLGPNPSHAEVFQAKLDKIFNAVYHDHNETTTTQTHLQPTLQTKHLVDRMLRGVPMVPGSLDSWFDTTATAMLSQVDPGDQYPLHTDSSEPPRKRACTTQVTDTVSRHWGNSIPPFMSPSYSSSRASSRSPSPTRRKAKVDSKRTSATCRLKDCIQGNPDYRNALLGCNPAHSVVTCTMPKAEENALGDDIVQHSSPKHIKKEQ